MYKLRAANEDDFKSICDLVRNRDELFLIYPAATFPWTVEQLIELSKVRTELTVVSEGEQVIGFANLYDYEPKKLAYVGNVVVDSAYRSRGIGKAIVQFMLKIAFNKLSLPEVRISVFNTNTPALLLYSSLGFVPYEIEERLDNNKARVALIHMRLARRHFEDN